MLVRSTVACMGIMQKRGLYFNLIGRNMWAVGLHGATARKSYALGHKSYACFSPSQSTHQPSLHVRRWGRRDVRELPPDLVVHRIARRCGHVLRRYSLLGHHLRPPRAFGPDTYRVEYAVSPYRLLCRRRARHSISQQEKDLAI